MRFSLLLFIVTHQIVTTSIENVFGRYCDAKAAVFIEAAFASEDDDEDDGDDGDDDDDEDEDEDEEKDGDRFNSATSVHANLRFSESFDVAAQEDWRELPAEIKVGGGWVSELCCLFFGVA